MDFGYAKCTERVFDFSKVGAVSKCHVQIEAAPLSQIVEKEMKIIQK